MDKDLFDALAKTEEVFGKEQALKALCCLIRFASTEFFVKYDSANENLLDEECWYDGGEITDEFIEWVLGEYYDIIRNSNNDPEIKKNLDDLYKLFGVSDTDDLYDWLSRVFDEELRSVYVVRDEIEGEIPFIEDINEDNVPDRFKIGGKCSDDSIFTEIVAIMANTIYEQYLKEQQTSKGAATSQVSNVKSFMHNLRFAQDFFVHGKWTPYGRPLEEDFIVQGNWTPYGGPWEEDYAKGMVLSEGAGQVGESLFLTSHVEKRSDQEIEQLDGGAIALHPYNPDFKMLTVVQGSTSGEGSSALVEGLRYWFKRIDESLFDKPEELLEELLWELGNLVVLFNRKRAFRSTDVTDICVAIVGKDVTNILMIGENIGVYRHGGSSTTLIEPVEIISENEVLFPTRRHYKGISVGKKDIKLAQLRNSQYHSLMLVTKKMAEVLSGHEFKAFYLDKYRDEKGRKEIAEFLLGRNTEYGSTIAMAINGSDIIEGPSSIDDWSL